MQMYGDLDKTRNNILKRVIAIFILVVLGFMCAGFLIAEVNAFPVYGVTINNTIQWNWSYDEGIRAVSVDGVMVQNFDNESNIYQQNFKDDIIPQLHIIRVYGADDIGTNITYTNPPINRSVDIYNIIYNYIWLFLGLMLIIISVSLGIEYLPIGSILFGFIGYGLSIDVDFIQGLIYVFLIVGALLVMFRE